jgi:CHAD domain-containing protein/CYTH domain-containing protein
VVVGTVEAGELLDEPAVVAVRRIARAQAERVRAAWRELAAADPTERHPDGAAGEALHEFRVALRSLRSWLRAHDDMLRVPKKARRRLRRAAQATNASRDAEVLAALLAGLPGMTRAGVASSRWWQERLGERARDSDVVDRVRHDIGRGLDALEQQLAVVRWKQPVDSPWSFASLAADLAVRLRTHRNALAAAVDEIDYARREVTIHTARIAAKRVRYLLDPVKSGVPEARPALKLLKSLQDDFGELHDLHVARNELDSGVIERAAHEANERSREILDAAGEGRVPRRFASKLGGFSSVAAAVREEEHARFKAIEVRWLQDSAATLFAAIDAATATLARRGGSDTEIEHKYLLGSEPRIPDGCVEDVIEIEQGYLPGERITERLRRESHADGTIRLVRTLKTGRGLVRTEIEEDVSPELFDALWPLTAGRRVRKRRTRVSIGMNMLEIDVFLDRTLVLAEVEVQRIDDAVDLPQWMLEVLVAEVTDDESYSNAKLAQPDAQ